MMVESYACAGGPAAVMLVVLVGGLLRLLRGRTPSSRLAHFFYILIPPHRHGLHALSRGYRLLQKVHRLPLRVPHRHAQQARLRPPQEDPISLPLRGSMALHRPPAIPRLGPYRRPPRRTPRPLLPPPPRHQPPHRQPAPCQMNPTPTSTPSRPLLAQFLMSRGNWRPPSLSYQYPINLFKTPYFTRLPPLLLSNLATQTPRLALFYSTYIHVSCHFNIYLKLRESQWRIKFNNSSPSLVSSSNNKP